MTSRLPGSKPANYSIMLPSPTLHIRLQAHQPPQPPSNSLPLNLECNRVRGGIHSRLGRPRRHGRRIKAGAAAVQQIGAVVGEDGGSRDRRRAGQRAAGDGALAFAGGEGEAGAWILGSRLVLMGWDKMTREGGQTACGGGEGGAGAAGVPRSGADDAAVLATAVDHVEVPRARQGDAGAGCGRGRRRQGGPGGGGRGAGFGQVLDAGRRAGRARTDRGGRVKSSALHGALHIVVVPELIELVVGVAVDRHGVAEVRGEGGLDGGQGVGCGRRGHDAGGREPRVRRERLEQSHSLVEEVYGFLLGHVVGVARGLQGADAGAVLGPLVLPEALVVSTDVLPVGLHVRVGGGGIGREKRAEAGIRTG